MPSPTTINRRAKKYGHKLKQFLPDCVAGTNADAVIPDGTKCHSQDDDRSSLSVKQRSAKTPPKSHAPCWICRSTLTGTKLPPNSMISAQSLTTRRSSVTLIAASSQPLRRNRDHQLDLVHVGRTLGLHPLGRWRLLPRPSEGDRFGGDRRGVPSHEELCGEASSSGGVRGDPLADRARGYRDSVATGAVPRQQRLQGIFGGGCRRL